MRSIRKSLVDYIQRKKVDLVDKGGNISYSLVVGCGLDAASGLDLAGIAGSRGYSAIVTYLAGGYYGRWRETMFRLTKTTKQHSRFRRGLVGLLAFNSFQVPFYFSALAVGNFLSEGRVDLEKCINGAKYLTMASPLFSTTLNYWMDVFRKRFKVKPAVVRAYEKKDE